MWTWCELEVLFDEKFGPACGRKSMERDGFKLSRSVLRQPSNSGKTHTWLVHYGVTAPDGTRTYVPDPGSIPPNRRNDPKRNWGLGRE